MKPAFIFLLAAGIAAASVVACGNSSGSAPGAPGKVSKLSEQNFESDVVRSPQPVLVDFFATWCGPCKRMAPIVDEFAQQHRDQFRVFECDIDQNRDLANRFGVDAVPTFMVFNRGKLVGRFMGSDTAESFESNIVGSLDTRLGSHRENE
jgi:thioredoxin 1